LNKRLKRDGSKPYLNASNEKYNSISTLDTALKQFRRLFNDYVDYEVIPKNERIFRMIISWIFLFAAKSVSLFSPLYFRTLVDQATKADETVKNFEAIGVIIEGATLGLICGIGSSRLFSGFAQLISSLILSPVTTNVAEILPAQAFSVALKSASRRMEESNTDNTSGSENEGKTGFARRALDRGLRASNQLLYRSIFNLLPSFIEIVCVLALIFLKTDKWVGLVATIVVVTFVATTSYIMHFRLPILRAQLKAENIASGFADDALSLGLNFVF
jgi:ABC-type multidrug transport system fused ATPase/permease subunit